MAMPLAQHHIEPMQLYRSDNRDIREIWKAGGFVPRYLLEAHMGGFDGFLACRNKRDGIVGCRCPDMDRHAILSRARITFQNYLRKPRDVQSHVISNASGYVSTSRHADDETISAEHRYEITVYFPIQGTAEDVRRILNQTGLPSLLALDRRIQFFLTPDCSLIAVMPIGQVEMTFLTPIPYMFITRQLR